MDIKVSHAYHIWIFELAMTKTALFQTHLRIKTSELITSIKRANEEGTTNTLPSERLECELHATYTEVNTQKYKVF
jgi:hypothetical protein